MLDTEHDRITHTAQRGAKGWITTITCYDLAVSAGTGEQTPWAHYPHHWKFPTQRVPENPLLPAGQQGQHGARLKDRGHCVHPAGGGWFPAGEGSGHLRP